MLVNDTAIIFFTRSASREAIEKSFLKTSHKSNKKIAESLISHSLATIKKTRLPFYVFNEKRQVGNTFNEKLLSAVTYGFDKGHHKLIVIGNDCPELTANDILIAAEELNNNDFIIGPTYNGGLYCLGLTENAVFQNFITNIEWQTSNVAERALSFLHDSEVGYYLLPTLSDFNDINDYTFLKLHLAVYNNLLKIIKSIIASYNSLFYLSPVKIIKCLQLSANQLRGPPILR